MSEAKHTPGPWALGGETPNKFRIVAVDDTEKFTIASVVRMDAYPSQSRGNAFLIAAAPDLLQACQDMLDELGEQEDGLTMGQQDAIKAIAKATGK